MGLQWHEGCGGKNMVVNTVLKRVSLTYITNGGDGYTKLIILVICADTEPKAFSTLLASRRWTRSSGRAMRMSVFRRS